MYIKDGICYAGELVPGITIFSKPVISHGTITWNNEEIDIAPEYIYQESYKYDTGEL